MFDIEIKWIERLYQALYLAESFNNEDLVWELKGLELNFFKHDLLEIEWARLSDIENEIENNR